jgi:hypothetical protein
MNLKFISEKTNKLDKKKINLICKLKDGHWKFGKKKQIEWFKKNMKLDDIHNYVLFESKIIGYTCLRERHSVFYLKKKIKKIKYLYFDTLIVDKKYQKMHIGKNLMNFNNKVIKKSSKIAFLTCKKKLVKFYEKFNWKLISNKRLIIKDHTNKTNYMYYNKKFLFSKVAIYLNKVS